jgi:capsule polysaccharide export protein KpsE/RkpR
MKSTPQPLAIKDEKSAKQRIWLRWVKYFGLGIFCNGLTLGLAFSYLKKTPPTYTSELLLHVAGNAPGVSVNLPDIGQANTSSATSFGANSDPRENYKTIATSPTVLSIAAKSLKIEDAEFGKPAIDLIHNTTFLLLEVDGKNPKQAREKAWSLYNAFYNRLNALRTAEQQERNKSVRQSLQDAKASLAEAQQRLSGYKLDSGFDSSDQIKDIISHIGNLQAKRIETLAQHEHTVNRLNQLANTLRISPQKAADALILQTDQEFQKSLKEYTDNTTILTGLLPNRGNNYPDVREARQKQQAALSAMLKRGQILLEIPVEQLNLERLILDNSNGSGTKRADLFIQLIDLNAEHQGLNGQLATFSEQIKNLETKLRILSQKESIYASLDRDLQIAQAVFASTLTKIDLSKGDRFASFPLMQLIEEPSLPTKPTSPKPKLVLAGALLGSIFISAGLTLIWWREPLVETTKFIIRKIFA